MERMHVHSLIHFNKMQNCCHESFGKIKTIKYATPCDFFLLLLFCFFFFQFKLPSNRTISTCLLFFALLFLHIFSIVSLKFNVTRALSPNYLWSILQIGIVRVRFIAYMIRSYVSCARAVNIVIYYNIQKQRPSSELRLIGKWKFVL